MATVETVKHICDRCGDSIATEVGDITDPLRTRGKYPSNWQHMHLGQTGAQLDLCDECNGKLVIWLSKRGATEMEKACINKREVL